MSSSELLILQDAWGPEKGNDWLSGSEPGGILLEPSQNPVGHLHVDAPRSCSSDNPEDLGVCSAVSEPLKDDNPTFASRLLVAVTAWEPCLRRTWWGGGGRSEICRKANVEKNGI